MKGVIFNLLEDVVLEEFGEEVWCALLDKSGASGSYTSLGSYPDTELLGLVSAAAAALDLSEREILRWFGQRAFPRLAARYPVLVENHASAAELVLSANTMIHPEVRKLYPGAICPHFTFQQAEQRDTMTMGYRSPRRLCSLVEGFLQGVAAHFATTVDVTHQRCTHEGAAECQLEVRWAA